MPYADNDGVKIYYEVHGEGTPFLLLRGLGGTVRGWADQVDLFADKYQMILVDNRGAGNSDKPDIEYTIDIFAQDLKCVLDHLGVSKIILLGLSMGGFIVQQFYHKYPEMVDALILGCTGMGLLDPHHIKFSQEVEDILHMERSMENVVEAITKMNSKFYHPDYIMKTPDLLEKTIVGIKLAPQPGYAFRRQSAACYANYQLSEKLKQIKVPVLLLHGTDDEVVPIENAEYMVQQIPNVKYRILERAGHMFFLENPDFFHEETSQFLNEL